MPDTSSKYDIPSDHILRWHLVEHYPSILHAPTFFAIAAISAATHRWWVSLVPKPECFPLSSYVWDLNTVHLSTTRNPDQADQPCIVHIPGINRVTKTEKATLTFSISTLHLLTLPSLLLLLLSHQCKGPEKNFCQSLDHSRIATKREQQVWHQQQDPLLHWHVNSDRIGVQLNNLKNTSCIDSVKGNTWGNELNPSLKW
jgi:hypothetical protein